MRTITGKIVLPENAPAGTAKLVVIEARDVSRADAPSVVIAEQRLTNVAVKPNGQVGFKLAVPEVEPNRTLSVRVHVSFDDSGRTKEGDLLTTASYSIPNTGGAGEPLEIRVAVI